MRAIGYREAIKWLCDNDDTCWVFDEQFGHPSVSASLVADIYGKSDMVVKRDIIKQMEKGP